MDEKEQVFLKSVILYLETTFDYDCSQDVFNLDSGDNSVIAVGPFGGKSLYALKKYVAEKTGKQVKYIHDDFD